LCFIQTKRVWAFLLAERTVTGIVYQDLLEEFHMPILEEEGPDDMLFQQSSTFP
jgi:hypothetical protein